MDAQNIISSEEMAVLIHTTLSETVTELSTKIEAYRATHNTEAGRAELSQIIDETRKFVVFLKYANEYMRKKLPQSLIREEMLRIKLHLLSILRALSDHVKAADHAAVYDLITEELRDNLTLWKINVLPLLRPQQGRANSRSGSIHP
jgi:hypothetical protein